MFAAWMRENWFPLLQGIGIMGGLIFTAISVRQATHARKVSDLLELTKLHHEVWQQASTRAELTRVLARDIDLGANPVTVAEERFLNEVIVLFITGWQLARHGSLLTLDALRADIRGTFKLPIPRAVWQESRTKRDAAFASFVEKSLRD